MIHIYVHRYIWGHRLALARRCHDMAKQSYDNKRYSPIAWRPLQRWLNPGDPTVKLQRLTKIKTFTRRDNDLIAVFAQGLWTLANMKNLPWGRGLTPQTYAQIPPSEKVVMNLSVRLRFFFSSSMSCAHICVPPELAHMFACYSGLGCRVCYSWIHRHESYHEHTLVQQGCKLP